MKQPFKDVELVLSMYQEGMTQNEVAKALGRSQHYVSIRLLAAGVQRPRRETNAIKAAKNPFVPRADIVELYRSGLSSTEIATRVGHSHGYVLRHVRAAGVVRGRGESLRIIAQRYPPSIRVGSHGYLVFSRDGRDVLLHRYVMEQKLGRKLRSDEEVHHRDKNRLNPAPGNLDLMSKSKHRSLHSSLDLTCLFCERRARGRNLCGMHYQRAAKAGTLSSYAIIRNLKG